MSSRAEVSVEVDPSSSSLSASSSQLEQDDGSSSSSRAPLHNVAPLSWAAPRVYHYPGFLSDEECDFLVTFANQQPEFSSRSKKAAGAGALASTYFGWDDMYTNPVVASIERRIGVVTGIPPHRNEEPINVHRIKQAAKNARPPPPPIPLSSAAGAAAGAGAGAALGGDVTTKKEEKKGGMASTGENVVEEEEGVKVIPWAFNRSSCHGLDDSSCLRSVRGVHHDKVQKEHSAATVIVYLNNVAEGGGTVWPCRSTPPSSSSSPSSASSSPSSSSSPVAESCAAAFERGARWFDGKSTTVVGKMRKESLPTEVDFELSEILWAAHAACAEPSETGASARSAGEATGAAAGRAGMGKEGPFTHWPAPPVRTQAVKGDAVVFFHNHPNGAPDPWAWHAGCLPLSGDKWTMQKFKEMPMFFRP